MYINEFNIMILCEYPIYVYKYILRDMVWGGWVFVHTEWYYTIFRSSQRIEQHLNKAEGASDKGNNGKCKMMFLENGVDVDCWVV